MIFNIMLTFLIFFFCQAKVILWDFGGVLFEPNKLGVAKEIGLNYFLSYMFLDQKNPNIEKLIFDILDSIENNKAKKNYTSCAGTAEGLPLPEIMCQWQAGKITGYEIIKVANAHIKKLQRAGYFSSIREKTLVQRTIKAMFDPEILAKNVDVVDAGIELLKQCSQVKNFDGTKRHINIGFSNWDPLSYDKFFARHKEAFKYFDFILISGHMGLIKPHKDAYIFMLNKFGIKPQDCLLIDDQDVNIKGARDCNIRAIRIKNGDYFDLRRNLIIEGILPAS